MLTMYKQRCVQMQETLGTKQSTLLKSRNSVFHTTVARKQMCNSGQHVWSSKLAFQLSLRALQQRNWWKWSSRHENTTFTCTSTLVFFSSASSFKPSHTHFFAVLTQGSWNMFVSPWNVFITLTIYVLLSVLTFRPLKPGFQCSDPVLESSLVALSPSAYCSVLSDRHRSNIACSSTSSRSLRST